jgi:hypothetical protein
VIDQRRGDLGHQIDDRVAGGADAWKRRLAVAELVGAYRSETDLCCPHRAAPFGARGHRPLRASCLPPTSGSGPCSLRARPQPALRAGLRAAPSRAVEGGRRCGQAALAAGDVPRAASLDVTTWQPESTMATIRSQRFANVIEGHVEWRYVRYARVLCAFRAS